LLRIEGMIVDGKSEQPPMGQPLPIPMASEPRAGDLTVVAEARAALEDDRVAAVVVYVDSPGGSATASEAMAAEIGRLAAKKPVVVSMGRVAASGGYYVATPAHWVMAQSSTITGSIGVISGKLVSAGLMDKLSLGRETLTRGEGADFATEEQPYTPDERRQLWTMIQRTYDVFKERVTEGRGVPAAKLESLAGGRVWTGAQAFEHGLIDEMGDLDAACEKARALAGLHHRAPLRAIRLPRTHRLPLPLAAAAGAELLSQSSASLAYTLRGMSLLEKASTLCLWPAWLSSESEPWT
jgi:protease-4